MIDTGAVQDQHRRPVSALDVVHERRYSGRRVAFPSAGEYV